MSKEIDSEEVYEDDTPELEQADALEDYDAVEDEKQAAKYTEESDKDTEDAQDEVSKKKKIRGIIAELCLYAAIIIVCGVFVPRYVIQRTIVDGKSMMNTLKDGENLLAEKVSYRFGEPKRFDVIVFYPYGRDNDAYYIKRVIGLPGETVQIKGSTIYIDGKPLKENYGKDPIDYAGIAEKPIKLGDDEYFVLGDNREISRDSRYEEVGKVKRKNIEGRAVLRIYPFDKFGTFR